MLRRLIQDGTISPLEKILKYLDIKRTTFDEDMKADPNQFRVYYRQKVESRVSNYYDMLKNLEAPNKIGQYGQRIPDIFDEVSSSFPEEGLPQKIRNLVGIKNDLVDLIFATTEIFMIYQSAMDLSFQIDVMKFDERNKLYGEVDKLYDVRNTLSKEVAELRIEKERLNFETNHQSRKTVNNKVLDGEDEEEEPEDEAPPPKINDDVKDKVEVKDDSNDEDEDDEDEEDTDETDEEDDD